jgi:hypothetical protein
LRLAITLVRWSRRIPIAPKSARRSLQHLSWPALQFAVICAAGFCVGKAVALGFLVPAYFDPDSSSAAWASLNQAALRVPLIAIANPNNGPTASRIASYSKAIAALRAAGGKVIGYVYSGYGQRPLGQIETDVDRYDAFYTLDGIFVDEMTNDSDIAHLAFYQTLFQYILSKRSTYIVIGNPGTTTLKAYLTRPVVTGLVTFENGSGYDQYVPDAWTQTNSPNVFTHLCYSVPSPMTMTNYVQLAVKRNAGYVYVTDDGGNNPWDTLASYWTNEVNLVEQINRTAATNRPAVLNIGLQTDNLVQVGVTGSPGRYVVEKSQNLREWKPIVTNVTATGSLLVQDIIQPADTRQVYRTEQ